MLVCLSFGEVRFDRSIILFIHFCLIDPSCPSARVNHFDQFPMCVYMYVCMNVYLYIYICVCLLPFLNTNVSIL